MTQKLSIFRRTLRYIFSTHKKKSISFILLALLVHYTRKGKLNWLYKKVLSRFLKIVNQRVIKSRKEQNRKKQQTEFYKSLATEYIQDWDSKYLPRFREKLEDLTNAQQLKTHLLAKGKK